MQPIQTTTISWLVAVSVLTSVVASYSAFGFAERVASCKGGAQFGWLTGGAMALGLGIWSMHYLGMLAVRLPIEVLYHVPTVFASLMLAVLASFVVLIVVSRSQLTRLQIGIGSVLMGSGIGAMHYTGMHAMRCEAMHHYRYGIVVLSVLVAVAFSWLALWIGFSVRNQQRKREWIRLGGAAVMGLGIAAMHYTAMAAVTFLPSHMAYSTENTVHISFLGVWAVMLTTGMVLCGGLIVALFDRQVYEQLALDRDRLHAASESSLDALYICEAVRDGKGEIEDFIFTYLNRNVEKMVTIPIAALLGAKMCEVLPVNRALGLFERYKTVVNTGQPLVYEFRVVDKDVKSSWIRIQAVKLRDGVAITASDITSRKRSETQILHQAHHDPLTGLVNRALLDDRVEQAIERAKRRGGKAGIYLIDLDGFKQINDQFGHATGDGVLILAASRLKDSVRASDSVIRIGGDEFVVVVLDLNQMTDIEYCACKIVQALSEPMPVGGNMVQVTCSLGIALYPDSAVTVEALLSSADTAMYRAKQAGKNRFAVAMPEVVAEPTAKMAAPGIEALNRSE